MYPGVYAMASVFFMVVIVFVGRDMARARKLEQDAAMQPLIADKSDEEQGARTQSLSVDC